MLRVVRRTAERYCCPSTILLLGAAVNITIRSREQTFHHVGYWLERAIRLRIRHPRIHVGSEPRGQIRNCFGHVRCHMRRLGCSTYWSRS